MKIGDRVRLLDDNKRPTHPEMIGKITGLVLPMGQVRVELEMPLVMRGDVGVYWESELESVVE